VSLLFKSAPTGPTKRYADPNSIPSPGVISAGLGYVYRTDDALRIAAVVACVGLRAGAHAQIPLKQYHEGVNQAPVMPQAELLTAPSTVRVVVPSVWKTQMSISRDVWGYAAGLIQGVDAAGYVSKVDWKMPGDEIRGVYDSSISDLRWTLHNQPIDSSLVFHVPSRWVMPGNPLGMSPLEHSGLVDLAKRAQDFGRDWFRNGAVPSALLYSDEVLTSDQADSILATILQRWRKRQPAVIGSGMKYEKVSVPANESQFIETMQRAAADIAISFNLPPSKIAAAVASGGDIKYQNLEMSTQQYLMDSINPDLVQTQEIIGLYVDPRTYLRWATGAFTRSDLKTRYETYQLANDIGILTIDEMRALEDMSPLSDEDRKQSKQWQTVGLPALVSGGVMTQNEARAQLGLGPVAGGDELITLTPGGVA
jgi:phage portal protein BeeE